uniref:Uncharacterized protein n=1 Tax=Anguilla anguilla TaxID=7936 RepID=A0A0E9PZT6_ANGAN
MGNLEKPWGDPHTGSHMHSHTCTMQWGIRISVIIS